MSTDLRSKDWRKAKTRLVPVCMVIAKSTRKIRVDGSYDEESSSWSDRHYAGIGPKKHNESM